MEKRYYIAYGSNLNLRQMKMRCPTAKVMGTAVIKDYELLFKGSLTGAYLTIEPKKGSEVPVAVWTVTETDEEALDRYEGCPVFYYKIGIPSLSYVRTCLEGYISFGFDEHYLSEAQIRAVKEAGYED